MTNEPISHLATALCAAQAEMPHAVFNRINPHFKSRYADLTSIRDASVKVLAKHGLSIVQFTRMSMNGEHLLLYTRLMHKSGEYIEGDYPVTLGKPQSMGSELTYAKRYGWASIIGMTADEDDDANAATETAVPRKSAYKARQDGDYPRLLAALNATETEKELRTWWTEHMGEIMALPDNWRQHLREAKEGKKIELTEGVSEDGKLSMKQRLRASVNAEEVE